MFDALKLRVNEAIRQTLGVDVPTAQRIISAHGSDCLLNTDWSPGGEMEFVTSEELPAKVEAQKAAGATGMSITVFERMRYQRRDGGAIPDTRIVGKYPIKLGKRKTLPK